MLNVQYLIYNFQFCGFFHHSEHGEAQSFFVSIFNVQYSILNIQFFNKHNAHKEIFKKNTKNFYCKLLEFSKIIFHFSPITLHFSLLLRLLRFAHNDEIKFEIASLRSQ
jgi:hypothetical protein